MSPEPQMDTVHFFPDSSGPQDVGLAAQQRAEVNRQGRSMRVMVVDDEKEVADSLCATVAAWGHEAWPFYDGASGLTGAVAELPQIVILDIAMPGMDGYELARHLRLEPDLQGCYVIAMRSSDKAQSLARWESAIDLYLAKPMNLSVLETLLLMEGERLDRLT